MEERFLLPLSVFPFSIWCGVEPLGEVLYDRYPFRVFIEVSQAGNFWFVLILRDLFFPCWRRTEPHSPEVWLSNLQGKPWLMRAMLWSWLIGDSLGSRIFAFNVEFLFPSVAIVVAAAIQLFARRNFLCFARVFFSWGALCGRFLPFEGSRAFQMPTLSEIFRNPKLWLWYHCCHDPSRSRDELATGQRVNSLKSLYIQSWGS